MDFEKRNKSKKKHIPAPTSLKELRMAYDKTDWTELTRFLLERVEDHEKCNGRFKGIGEMYSWIRKNVKTTSFSRSKFLWKSAFLAKNFDFRVP